MADNDFGPDGTQAPPPPRLFPDPLAGLVTADTFTASAVSAQWAEYSESRVVAPTPPSPEDMRRAIEAVMEQEKRRPRGRVRTQTPAPSNHETWQAQAPMQQSAQQFAQMVNKAAAQQNQAPQPQQKSSGAGAVIGCLLVLAFFVLVIINIISSILG